MATKTKYVAPTANYWSTTLNGAISDAATTITLNSVTNLQAPGYLVIDREDGSGNATPTAREVIYFTGISGNDITGVTREADNSTARSHSDGALVESTMTVGVWNSLVTVVDSAIDDAGYLKAIASPVSISRLEAPFVRAPEALVSVATVLGHLNVSGASVVGIPLTPVFVFTGNLSGPTTLIQTPLPMPRAGQWSYANVITRTVASTTSVVIDINKNGTSIFSTGTKPTIVGGGTFVSTASINTKNFDQGDRISWDCDMTASEDGHITDLDVILRST
jgi:hypothetical protein